MFKTKWSDVGTCL